jgi:hypothetical protein
MSTSDTVLSTQNFQITNFDTTKIFLFGTESETGTMDNSTYDDANPGTAVARIAATGKIVPLNSAASDGSQFPVGILMNSCVAGASNVDVTFCIAGDVDGDSVAFLHAGDTLNTVVSSRQLRDRIASDTQGIRLVFPDELSGFDNQ